jgi:drug/metabolite transporter (DMT)-like permease
MTFMSIVAQALGWVLWLFIVGRLPAGVAGIGSLATPVIAVFLAALQLGEIPSPSELVGMVLIVIALVVNSISSSS